MHVQNIMLSRVFVNLWVAKCTSVVKICDLRPISIARYKIRPVIKEVICDLPDCDMTSDSHFSYWEGFQGDSVEKYNI